MTQQGSSSSSSSSSFSHKWTYDVFLSFRGEDTRKGFTGNLYNALRERGIHTFFDDAKLRKGEEIKLGLIKAIEESRIAIVVLSKNYASSRFCLDELVKILDSIKGKGRLVLPVFYKVEPSDVRHQKESYGKALAKHEARHCHGPEKVKKWRSVLFKASNLPVWHFKDHNNVVDEAATNHWPEKQKKWRSALFKVANFSGWHLKEHTEEYEYTTIRKIVKVVSNKINRIPLHIVDRPIGLGSRVAKVNSLLDVQSDDKVTMVGIYGIGGIGKSTIARAVYNSIADQFEDLCFLSNVREKSVKHGLAQLQETLLYELTGERDIKFADVNRGIPILKSRLNRKKVLLVLDDIDKLEQLQALAGGEAWFGSGSRIIITTRDTHLLTVHGIQRGYNVEELNQQEAIELFSWKAFKRCQVDRHFKAVSKRAVLCGHGLPLALEIIGSNLYNKKHKEWNSALDKYEKNSDEIVQEVLKVSYNSLRQDEKEIFLDICCFFNGERLQYVISILQHAHFSDPDYVIGVLTEKSLVKISKDFDQKVELHPLIQDMGKKIVEQESLLEPGGRSRLWSYEDTAHVLEDDTGTDKIKFMMLNLGEDEMQWSGKAFEKMKNLEVLSIKNATFSQGFEYLPNSLRALDWKGYPLSSLPSNFHPKKLGILKLDYSFFKFDKPLKDFVQLSVISLKGCEFLIQVPNLSEIPNLRELYVDFCKNLTGIHDYVGFQDKLRVISAKSCIKLKTLPRAIKLASLENLELRNCSSLKTFPEILGNMENLSYISLCDTAIEELPCSIENVTGLNSLDLSNCRRLRILPSCILMLPKLKKLLVGNGYKLKFISKTGEQEPLISTERLINLGSCSFLDGFLPTLLSSIQNVTLLNLSESSITLLPASIEKCEFLTQLYLDNCKQLREIFGIPPNLKVLSGRNCISLMSSSLNLLTNQNIHSGKNTHFTMAKTTIPKWLDHCCKGASLSFWFRDELPDAALSIVVRPNGIYDTLLLKCCISINNFEVGEWFHQISELETEHTFLFHLRHEFKSEIPLTWPPRFEWNLAEISYEFKFNIDQPEKRKKPLVQRTGIYVHDRTRIVYEDIQFRRTDPRPRIIILIFSVILALLSGSPFLFLVCFSIFLREWNLAYVTSRAFG